MHSYLFEKSVRCRILVLSHEEPISDELYNRLEAESAELCKKLVRAGRKRSYAEDPVTRAEGPLLACAELYGIDHKNRLRDGKWKNE